MIMLGGISSKNTFDLHYVDKINLENLLTSNVLICQKSLDLKRICIMHAELYG
jgi:hypothetical protein